VKEDSTLVRIERHLQRWISSVVFELRRTRRVIVDPAKPSSGEPPIFVIGTHRSGTTLLRLILDSHSRIACPPESFFIASLEQVLRDAKALEGLQAMGFDREHVVSRLRETTSYFFERYAAVHEKVRWADKTPSYVDCLEFLDVLFPDARYLMIFRHGLDVACSIANMGIREVEPFIDTCGGDRHAGAARYWAVQCEKMLLFQSQHRKESLELRYEELTTQPETVMRRALGFVDEAWEEQVLRFHESPHDHWIGLQDSKAASSTGFEPRIGTWRSKPQDVIDAMLAQAGAMLDRLGYTTAPASDR
jgi:hypothetical protein